ncbi:MBL fold metallo-hydrolase [Solihabitans fulvus]|uniref:MBL fold metallo-hydrolase n=1 Tax=Solihabitans fulvus TaxID=1892852 RepID=A0A5B2X5V7_9PSEU|nr:MBL fold metallo-hydrolase [Solihabitans fulvus]KAA2258737.1 MBL fold metallo-hydrolase [Solihabitans fulvus]
MRLIKYSHACVRLEQDDRVLVIDPGVWSEAEALIGVTDVLITHEHADHVDLDRLKAAEGVRIFAPAEAAAQATELGERVVTVAAGEDFTAGGFSVRAVGGLHAEIFDGLPGCANLGYIVEGVYHPGDSFFVPDEEVDTLLVPAAGPWFKLGEALEFTRAVKPARAFPIHDAPLNDLGKSNVDGWMDFKGDTQYARLGTGESTTW